MTAVLALLGVDVPFPTVLLGAIIGMTYGLLAAGLVLVYRSSRIINFAHGEIGAFGAAVFAIAVTQWGVPYYAALPFALGAASAIAVVAEIAVVRRLREAPRIMSIVATLGVGQFLVFFSLAINPESTSGRRFPSPPGLPEFDVGSLRLTQSYVGMLIGGPIAVLLLAMFLQRSRFGLGIRSAAANPEAARMAGIFASRMSAMSWALAGAMSAFTAILVLPSSGVTSGESFGPTLLLRALAAAVIARMTSLPIALAAGVGIGVAEQVLLWNYPSGGLVELVLFVAMLVALLFQRGMGGREEEKGSWAAVQGWRPIPDAVAKLPEIRLLPWLIAAAAIGVGVALPAVMTNSAAVTVTGIFGLAIVGLSVGIVTGLTGQLSLGQFALAGIGAVVSYQVSSRTGWFPLSLLYAGLAAAGASLVIGVPALRIRGLLLAVSTLGFALVTSSWLLQQPWALSDGVDPGKPIVFGTALSSGKSYYFFALAVLVIAMWLARNVRRGAVGRLLVAVRDNEDNARAFTVRARVVKVQGFLVAGFLAGVGGAVYGHMLSNLSASAFPTRASIEVVAMTVIGGMSLLAAPLLGAFYIIGIPAFLPLDSAGLAATQLGWLLLVLYLPGGLAQALEPLRERYVRRVAVRHRIDLDDDVDRAGSPALTSRIVAVSRDGVVPLPRRSDVPMLEASGVCKRFGGVTAVDHVSLQVGAGQIVGLIGPNGAGKTTTFEILSGFTRPDEGAVYFDGEDVSSLGPEARASLGLIRSFQDAALFPTMTALECAMLALERRHPTRFLGSVLGLPGSETQRAKIARELISALGLDRYRDKQIRELSTGTRRITEIACLIGLQPRLLLLDEPSSGIAQRETEALGLLLRDIRRELDLTMLVIEHDMPLIMGLSDRVFAMDAGKMIASGTPDVVRTDPLVVEAYLGGDIAAVERSGAVSGRGTADCAATIVDDASLPPVPAVAVTSPGWLRGNGFRVPGMGPQRLTALEVAFADKDALAEASLEDISSIPGIGPVLGRRIFDRLRTHPRSS